MIAVDIINALTDLGTLLVNFKASTHGLEGAIRFPDDEFLKLNPDDLWCALGEIRATQRSLLAGRQVGELSISELDKYLALGNVALQIAVAKDTAGNVQLFEYWLR